jgi:putative tryptophan/tyrosine transport system substrate-binding protein
MNRRDLITLLGGAAMLPVAARAQQAAMPAIGLLSATSRSADKVGLSAFKQGLLQQGYVEDRNLSIQYSWADGHFDLLPSMAAEFVRRRVAVIVTLSGTEAAEAAKAATSTIPVVFAFGSDPVTAGLVKSLSRPGGNVTGSTGMSVELGPKRVELLRAVVPTVTTIGLFTNPDNRTFNDAFLTEVQRAAVMLKLEVHAMPVSSDSDIGPAFDRLHELRVGALLISTEPFYYIRREQIVRLAAQHRIPVVYSYSEFVKAGGLMSYGVSRTFAPLTAGNYAGRLLKGEEPADLPVLQPTKFELGINLKTAKELGLNVPPSLLAIADEVIE